MRPRSPLKAKPLRMPGQSLDAEINYQIGDQTFGYMLASFAMLMVALFEWIAYLAELPRAPGKYTLAAVLTAAFCGWRIWLIRRRVQQLRLGRDGERAVAEFLDTLREQGFKVLHDIPADDFNLDHVVIAPYGVYLIETKTRSKRERDSRIVVEGDTVSIAGARPDADPISQTKAQAKWLSALLRESTGKAFFVRGVVVFPGWWVEQRGPRGDVWVLEPKALPSFIEHQPKVLSDADVHLIAFHLKRYVRTCVEPPQGFSDR